MSRKPQSPLQKPAHRLPQALAVLLLFLTVLALASCAGGRKSPVTALAPTVERSPLEAALAELDALETPEGVDEALFADLREALKAELLTYGIKSTATPPTGLNNRVDDLTVESDDGMLDFASLNIEGEDLGILIGRKGQTLSSLQYMVRLTLCHQTQFVLFWTERLLTPGQTHDCCATLCVMARLI